MIKKIDNIEVKTSVRVYSHKSGFTLIEILTVVFLVGLIALPFSNMFIFGVKGSNSNTEHVIAYNLAREKLEEIKGLPFSSIKSDYENFREVYQDRSKYDDAYYNEDNFVNYFSDVFSETSMNDTENEKTYKKLKDMYPAVYLKPLTLYPNGYDKFRRVVRIEEISESAMPPTLKKVTVLVFNNQEKKIAELRTFVGKHK